MYNVIVWIVSKRQYFYGIRWKTVDSKRLDESVTIWLKHIQFCLCRD